MPVTKKVSSGCPTKRALHPALKARSEAVKAVAAEYKAAGKKIRFADKAFQADIKKKVEEMKK